MSIRLLRRVYPTIPLARGLKTSSSPTILRPHRWMRLGLLSGGVLGASLFVGHTIAPLYADDAQAGAKVSSQTSQTPLSTLMRSYVVYTMCSFPTLVDWSPTMLSFFSSVPGLKQITEGFVRRTFFAQFVGGETAHECVPLLEQFRAENKGALFAYSVEVDEHEAAGQGHKPSVPVHKRIVQEMIRSIDVAADFEDRHASGSSSTAAGRRTWVAVKLTALLPDAQALTRFSVYLTKTRPALSPAIAFPGCPRASDMDCLAVGKPPSESPITEQDVVDIKELHSDLVKICARAQERGIRIIIDAEHRQPAIDAVTLSLMRQFNALPNRASTESTPVRPLVYATFQAYLRRNVEHLQQSLADAKAGNYALGVKLVRGAYHPLETSAHAAAAASSSVSGARPRRNSHSLSISSDPHPPVWPSKPDTDRCYNACARLLVSAIHNDVAGAAGAGAPPTIGVLFGSHNWDSCNLILDELVRHGLAHREIEGAREVVKIRDEATERVTLAQLFGMSDALTDYLVDKTRSSSPFVIKYVPYGALSEVMPYLSRRAIENKSVLGDGQAAAERKRAWDGIRVRLFG